MGGDGPARACAARSAPARRRGRQPNYTAQLRDTRGDLEHNHGVVVDLTGKLSRYLAARGHWPPPAQLAPHLGLAAPQGAGGDAILRPDQHARA